LGPNGVEKIHGTGKLTPFEQKLLEAAMAELNTNIKSGVEFVTKKK
jgi:malate dehydrogenase